MSRPLWSVGMALVFAAVLLAACESAGPAPTPSRASPLVTLTKSPTAVEPSSADTSGPSPIALPGGVVPADPDAFSAVLARSVVAVVRSGQVGFVDRILGDAQSASTCAPFQDIVVLSKADAGRLSDRVRRAVRVARARNEIDGVGKAFGRMQPGVDWPGVSDPSVVAVVIAIDCPEQAP